MVLVGRAKKTNLPQSCGHEALTSMKSVEMSGARCFAFDVSQRVCREDLPAVRFLLVRLDLMWQRDRTTMFVLRFW